MDTTLKYMWYGLAFFAVIVIDMIIPHFIIVTLAALALGGLTGALKVVKENNYDICMW